MQYFNDEKQNTTAQLTWKYTTNCYSKIFASQLNHDTIIKNLTLT